MARKSKKKKSLYQALRVTLAIAIALFLVQIQFDFIEAFFYDLRVRITPSNPVSGHVVNLAIDTKTQQALGGAPNALDHARQMKWIPS